MNILENNTFFKPYSDLERAPREKSRSKLRRWRSWNDLESETLAKAIKLKENNNHQKINIISDTNTERLDFSFCRANYDEMLAPPNKKQIFKPNHIASALTQLQTQNIKRNNVRNGRWWEEMTEKKEKLQRKKQQVEARLLEMCNNLLKFKEEKNEILKKSKSPMCQAVTTQKKGPNYLMI